jgi:hypothetical protein
MGHWYRRRYRKKTRIHHVRGSRSRIFTGQSQGLHLNMPGTIAAGQDGCNLRKTRKVVQGSRAPPAQAAFLLKMGNVKQKPTQPPPREPDPGAESILPGERSGEGSQDLFKHIQRDIRRKEGLPARKPPPEGKR